MSDEYKSAVELALERLRARDGAVETSLSAAQKQAIASVRRDFQARRAEHELTLRTALDKAVERGDAEKLKQLEADDRRERERLAEQEEREVERIRTGGA